ncbi:MAG TPA: DnaT-like ssDNA-binding protein [Pyrinomonadaceae bacterium]|jgi:hypothetical protein
MLTLDATAGGSQSNTFVTLAEAESYFASRLPFQKTNWTAAGEDDERKKAALISAVEALESLRYAGERTNTRQRLKFPRAGLWTLDLDELDASEIPRQMKVAQCELAEYMLGQVTPTSSALDRFDEITLPGGLRIKPRKTSSEGGVIPEHVLALLADLMLSGSTLLRA